MKSTHLIFFILLLMFFSKGCAPELLVNESIKNPLPECPDTPNCIRTSFLVEAPLQTISKAALNTLKKMKAYETAQKDDSTIEAVFRIPVFGWKDDVQIVIKETDNSNSVVHIRSASRTGRSDLGVNTRRVNRFFRWLEKETGISYPAPATSD
jgi:uncharacterized protein (DUF1499 family)